jgi:hypothetical protein
MSLRILHTADWQLGKPFGGFAGDVGAVLREARFEAVRTLARLARERRVDAVLVAGDVFDTNHVQPATIRRALAAMREFAGRWVLLPGNHDSALASSVWTRLRAEGPPEGVHVVTEPGPLVLADHRLAVLAAPLTERHASDDLTAWMDGHATPDGVFRVGLAHGAVAERLPAGSEAYNPVAADRAERARLDYLALGDWHGTLEVGPRAWYSGTPEADRFRDNAQGQALLVEIGAPGAPPRVAELAVGAYRWRQVAIDCSLLAGGLESPAEALRRALGDLTNGHRQLVQLRMHGCAGFAHRGELLAEAERLRGELACLEVDDAELTDEPSGADSALLDDAGVAGEAAARLRERIAAGGPDAPVAGMALRLLFGQASALRSASR